MRSFAMFALLAAVIVLVGAMLVLYRRYEKSTVEYTESQSRYTEAINAIAEIQDSLLAITPSDSTVGMVSRGLQTEQNLTEPQTRQALDHIALINGSILRTKEKIRDLEGRLKKTGVRASGLERMIAKLRTTLADKEQEVGQLTGRMDSLQTQVTGLQTEVQQGQETIRARDQTLEERRSELATIYYIVATKNDLKTSGIIMAKGGFLGVGKTVQLTGRYDQGQFSSLDTDQETLIRTPAPKARILSAQPATSYEMKLEGDHMELHILDPKEFRKVKHVVIMTG